MTAFFPKKSLGQNFLVNPRTRDRIIRACDLKKDDLVLEIGPGKGILTYPISSWVQRVYAIEKDDFLARQLRSQLEGSNVTVVHADILRYPFIELPRRMKVIGNLPYNIATPIIEKVLTYRHQFSVFYMTVQLEYGNRIVATPGTREYSSLSCFVQYYAQPQRLFKIAPGAFSPAPKVDSCFMCLKLRQEPLWKAYDEGFLFKLIRSCFNQRRKTIRNSLATIYSTGETERLLCRLEIDPWLRPQDLSLKDYVRLANKEG